MHVTYLICFPLGQSIRYCSGAGLNSHAIYVDKCLRGGPSDYGDDSKRPGLFSGPYTHLTAVAARIESYEFLQGNEKERRFSTAKA
jgi:hypothetical protein